MRHPGRLALLCLLAAGLCYLAVHWLNRPALWRPVVVATETGDVAATAPLAPNTAYEVSLEVDRTLARTSAKAVATAAPQSVIAGHWAVSCAGKVIATGDVDSYSRISGPRSWRGEVFRTALRVPFGMDETKYHTFGISGSYLTERVVGRFESGPGDDRSCSLAWQPDQSTADARLTLRKSRSEWQSHIRQVSFLLIGVPMFGLLGLAAGWQWYRSRRQARLPR